MAKNYYPAAYEIIVETFYPPIDGAARTYSAKRVLEAPFNKEQAEGRVQELRKEFSQKKRTDITEYVSYREIAG